MGEVEMKPQYFLKQLTIDLREEAILKFQIRAAQYLLGRTRYLAHEIIASVDRRKDIGSSQKESGETNDVLERLEFEMDRGFSDDFLCAEPFI